MKRLSKQNKRFLLRRQIIQELKKKKRNFKYIKYKPIVANNSWKFNSKTLTTKIIRIPKALDLDSNRVTILGLLNEVRGALVHGKDRRVFLDFSQLVAISSEAGLMLLAEIDRSLALAGGRVLHGNHPNSVMAASMLKDMGYFRFFKVPDPPINPSSRIFLEARGGSFTDGEIANKLIEVFENQLRISSISRRALYEALIECMQNVKHHAYPDDFFTSGKLRDRWWMMGFSDSNTGEVTFSFVDQGVGIPRTLQRKWKQLLNQIVGGFSESELICGAIEEHKSRLKSIRRGNGLSVLRSLLQLAPEGRFRICSRHANVSFLRHQIDPITFDAKESYDGTFVSWTLFSLPNAGLYAQNVKGSER